MSSTFKMLTSRRMLAVLLFGFVSGLPLALTAATLQAWLTVSGVSLMTIGWFGLVGQPYVFKFLWAPFLDRYVPKFLGRRRGWLLILQMLLMASIALLACLKPQLNLWLMGLLAFFIAFVSATQDIVINAYTAEILPTEERGLGAAMTIAGYRVAAIVSGGVALILASYIGWKATYLLVAAFMSVGLIAIAFAPEPKLIEPAPVNLLDAAWKPFKEFLTRDRAVIILLFIVLYKFGDATALALNSTFLMRGVGFSLIDVGTIMKFGGMAATLIGTFVGGALLARIGLYRALFWFGIGQGLSNLMYAILALVGKSYPLMATTIGLEFFTGGMATAAFLAYLMTLCDRRYTATQFALLSAIASIGRVYVGPLAATLIKHVGWADFFFITFLLTLPGLFLLRWLRERVDFSLQSV